MKEASHSYAKVLVSATAQEPKSLITEMDVNNTQGFMMPLCHSPFCLRTDTGSSQTCFELNQMSLDSVTDMSRESEYCIMEQLDTHWGETCLSYITERAIW